MKYLFKSTKGFLGKWLSTKKSNFEVVQNALFQQYLAVPLVNSIKIMYINKHNLKWLSLYIQHKIKLAWNDLLDVTVPKLKVSILYLISTVHEKRCFQHSIIQHLSLFWSKLWWILMWNLCASISFKLSLIEEILAWRSVFNWAVSQIQTHVCKLPWSPRLQTIRKANSCILDWLAIRLVH